MWAAATAPKQTFQGSGSIGLRGTFCVIDLAAMSHFGHKADIARFSHAVRNAPVSELGIEISAGPKGRIRNIAFAWMSGYFRP
jgi:hypothetical protein